jgi:hypothetical protein
MGRRIDGFLGTLIPWWFLTWACKRWRLCWCSCVDFKMHGPLRTLLECWRGERSMRPEKMCFDGWPTPHDFCGWYPEHPLLDEVRAERAGEARP